MTVVQLHDKNVNNYSDLISFRAVDQKRQSREITSLLSRASRRLICQIKYLFEREM